FDQSTFTYTQTLTDWPELREDAFFHTKREVYVLEYLKHCYSKKLSHCRLNAQEAWHMGRKNLDNGTLIAQVLATNDPSVDITPYITLALKADVSRFYCRKDFIQGWLISKIAPRILATEDPADAKQTVLEYA